MSRDATPYTQMTFAPVGQGIDVSTPVAGYFRHRLRGGSIAGGVRIWFGPPHDPVTGEELDRSWRWQATFNGEPVELDQVWPVCAGDPISEADHAAYVRRAAWAKTNAPNSAFARPGKRWDPLSSDNPLPF